MSSQQFTVRWGIVSTGMIADLFVKDLLVDPKTRNVHDVQHKVTAVASRSIEKAREFINKTAGGDASIHAYGSYQELYADKDVDVVYIGTPHTMHYENALDSIKAGKHVLCEKPVTSNAAELRSLLEAAKEHNVFFMEALWTRFQPLTLEVKKIIDEGSLGLPMALYADLSMDFNIQNMPKTHRILNPALGGGALLDLGPYPLFWATLAFYEHRNNKSSQPSRITATMLKTPLTNVDSNTSFTVTFAGAELAAQAVLSCNINVQTQEPSVIIRFERGSITIPPRIFCPSEFTLKHTDNQGRVIKEEKKEFAYVGVGWHFQADEVARCIRDGKKESSLWGHDKSILEMDVFDEVRRQGDYKFPPGVERVV